MSGSVNAFRTSWYRVTNHARRPSRVTWRAGVTCLSSPRIGYGSSVYPGRSESRSSTSLSSGSEGIATGSAERSRLYRAVPGQTASPGVRRVAGGRAGSRRARRGGDARFLDRGFHRGAGAVAAVPEAEHGGRHDGRDERDHDEDAEQLLRHDARGEADVD